MTAQELHRAERAYRAASARAEAKRLERNALVHQAIREGWTAAQVARELGLGRARVGQILNTPEPVESALRQANKKGQKQ